ATVALGGVAATGVNVMNATTITAVTGPHAKGLVSIVVTNPDTQASTLTNAFSYSNGAPPTITSITPNAGSENGGTVVTVVGTNFLLGVKLALGGAIATNLNLTAETTFTAKTAAHFAGPVN